MGVAVDDRGNVYVTGMFSGTVDFGGGALTSASHDDIFLASYTIAGVHRWSQRFGGTWGDSGRSVTVDGSGNIYLTGNFADTVDFGGRALTSATSPDIFLASFTGAGAHRWSQRFGSTAADEGMSVAVDARGNVYLTGNLRGTASLGGEALTCPGGVCIFLASYTSAGGHRWSQYYRGGGEDDNVSVAVDGAGNVYLAGGFQGTVDFGGGALISAGGYDIFLASFTEAGAHRWSQRFGSPVGEYGLGMAVDGSGNVYLTGVIYGTVSLGGADLLCAGMMDIFLASYTSAGAHRWSQRFGGASGEEGRSVALDGSGNVYLTGVFGGTVNFGGGALTSAGGLDIFLASYTSAGAHRWSERFGGGDFDRGWGVTVDDSGNVSLTGSFADTVDFCCGGLTSAGATDIFLLHWVE
jgi:hypothetical protein